MFNSYFIVSNDEIEKILNEKWNNMSNEEKQVYFQELYSRNMKMQVLNQKIIELMKSEKGAEVHIEEIKQLIMKKKKRKIMRMK